MADGHNLGEQMITNSYPNQSMLGNVPRIEPTATDYNAYATADLCEQRDNEYEVDRHEFPIEDEPAFARYEHLWPSDASPSAKSLAARVLREHLLTGLPTMVSDPDEKSLLHVENVLNTALGDHVAALEVEHFDDVAFITIELAPHWPISMRAVCSWV